MPGVKGTPIGNGWLYRSAVATFGDHQPTDILFGSFMSQERGDVSARILGGKKILITFPLQERMHTFVDDYKRNGSQWFVSVDPWSVNLECSFERDIWLSCYGVPIHA
ncbi:hypothetical protein Dimus_000180 [Dionaea muscipula]